MIHPFFNEIKKFPELAKEIRFDITDLPKPYVGKNKIKAILFGADPTNDGIRKDKGLKELENVFGIESDYERYFFAPQLSNLEALGISKDDLFIQNICRNYFINQTGKNAKWSRIARLWIEYLNKEIDHYPNIPVLVTAEKIMKVITNTKLNASHLYKYPGKYLPLWSESLQRDVYPLYRHPSYYLSNNSIYRNYLRKILS